MSSVKVTDGDLVLVNTAGMSEWRAQKLAEKIKQWASNRGMGQVDVFMTCTADVKETTQIDVIVISANDVIDSALQK